jgi:hypothetical protein
MTQDFYLGRRAVDSQAALALDAALRDAFPETQKDGKSVGEAAGQEPGWFLACEVVRHQGLEPRTY